MSLVGVQRQPAVVAQEAGGGLHGWHHLPGSAGGAAGLQGRGFVSVQASGYYAGPSKRDPDFCSIF